MCDTIYVEDNTTMCFTNHHPRTCTFTWTICGFSSLTSKTGEFLRSAEFHHPNEQGRILSLEFYPKGNSEENADYLSLFLNVNLTVENVFSDVTLGIVDHHGVVTNKKEFSRIFEVDSNGFGWPRFVSAKELERDDLLSGDKLVLYCHATTYVRESISNRVSKAKNFNTVRYKTLAEDMNKLLSNKSFGDVSVKVEGKEFKCCKNILSCRSPIFDSKLKEIDENGFIELGVVSDCLETVFRYLHSADLEPLTVKTTEKFLEASEVFQLPCLRKECLAFLKSAITVVSVWDITEIAVKHNEQNLREMCYDFIHNNVSSVIPTIGQCGGNLNQHCITADLIKIINNVQPRMIATSCQTKNCSKTFFLRWTISGFSKCTLKLGEYIYSSKFFHSEEEDLTCYLRFYPMGSDKESSDYVSLDIITISERENFFGNYKLGIVHKEGDVRNLRSGMLSLSSCWSFFIPKVELFKEHAVLAEDKLVLHCEVNTYQQDLTCNNETLLPYDEENVRFKSLSESLGKLLENETFSDVALKVGTSQFAAHKNILSVRSPVFEAMFQSDMRERQSGSVDITDIDSAVFQVLLRYLYTAELPRLTLKMATGLLAAADKYQVQCLKQECADYLRCTLSVANAADIVIASDLHNEPDLKKAAVELICTNMAFVTDWEQKLESRPHLMTEIFTKVIQNSQPEKVNNLS